MIIFHKICFRAIYCSFIINFFSFITNCYAIDLSSEEKSYLLAKETITFVSQTRYPPFEFTDTGQQHEGIMIDVVRWMAMEMGFLPVFVDMSFEQAQEEVLAGKADIITSLFFSDKRKEKFEFTDTLFDVPASIFVKAERTDIKDLNNLSGKTIAIQRGDYAKDFLASQKIRFDPLDTEDFAEATDMVIVGKADAVIGDEQIVLYHIFSNRLADRIKKIGDPLYIGKNCMASSKSNTMLIGILNKGILEARKTGVLDKICKKWLGTKYGHQESFLEHYLIPLSAGAGSLLLLSLGIWIWNVRLRILVRKKTGEIARHKERFHLALRGADLGMWDWNIMTGEVIFNTRWAEMLGYTLEEIEPHVNFWEKRIHPDDLLQIQGVLKSHLLGETPYYETEHRLVTKSGQYIWTLAKGKVTHRDVQGHALRAVGTLLDITERKRVEQQYRDLFESSKDGITQADLHGKIQNANAAYCEMLGYSKMELKQLTYRQLTPAKWHDGEDEIYRSQIMLRGYSDEHEKEYIKKDGTIFPITLRTWLIKDEQGNPSGVWAIVRDITEHKRAETELQESEKHYRLLVTLLNDGFFMTDSRGFLTFANDALARIYGFETTNAVIGIQIFDLVAPSDRERARQIFFAAVTSGHAPPSVEIGTLRTDGEVVQTEVKPTLIFHKDGTVTTQGLLIDISQRKRAEEALRKSEERLNLALTASQNAIWDWDLLTDELYYSSRWWSMVGYELNELEADSDLWRRLMHQDDLERANLVVSEAIAGETSFTIETRLLHKQGQYVPILTRGFVLRDESGQAVRILGTNTDLTEQKRAEEERRQWGHQLQQLQKTESLNRMAGAIAHNFNNLLGAVMGNLELAISYLPTDAKAVKNLNSAMKASNKAAEISSLMLTYLGRTFSEHVLLDLSELCRQNLAQLQAIAPKNLVFNTDLSTPGPTIQGNANQMQQILINLATNAWEAYGENFGTIDLTVKTAFPKDIPAEHRFPFGWQSQDLAYACLAVTDTGCGIENEDIDKLFDPFFSGKFPGRGLGLPVVLGIVKEHNGVVTVESEMGKGSRFQVFLPLSAEAVAP